MAYRNKTYVCFDADNDMRYYTMMKAWKQNENISFDFNNDCREKQYKVSGAIKVGKIEKESDGVYKIYSEGSYNQYKSSTMDVDDYEGEGSQRFRDIVIYVNCTKEKIEIIKTGDKIKFESNFNNINDNYLILTEGEILE
jgi:hypothetical protein